MTQPDLDLLDRMLISRGRGTPLHIQIQSALRDIIEEHFEDGQGFWTEATLMEKLGVSRATIRHALADLSHQGLLVRHAARGSFVHKSSSISTVGIIFHRYNSDFQVDLLDSFASECRRRGLALQLYHSHNGETITDVFNSISNPPQQERIILLGEPPDTTAQLQAALRERGYRTVTVDTLLSFPGAGVATDSDCAVQIGIEHLQKLGHQRIVLLVNEPIEGESVRRKVNAFEAMRSRMQWDHSPVFICGARPGDHSFEGAYRAMEQIWALKPRPTAIFTVSDPGAWAVLKWLAERKITAPAEVSVLSFEGVRPSEFTYPALTTIAHPVAQLARRAIEMLWETSDRQELLPPYLIIRESTGPAPGCTEKNISGDSEIEP